MRRHRCTVCGQRSERGERYAFCGVTGELCPDCSATLAGVITTWMRGRLEHAEVEQARLEREKQRRSEEAVAAELAKEIAADRMQALRLEGLPIKTRSEIARARRRSAA